MVDYNQLLNYCVTANEAVYIQSLIDGYAENKTHVEISRAIGVADSTLRRAVARISKRAAVQGVQPENGLNKPLFDPYILKGTSTLYDKNGDKKLEWVKTTINPNTIKQVMLDMVAALKEDIPHNPVNPTSDITNHDDQLLNLHVLADYHLGSFSWGEINGSGSDWTTETAERFIVEWFRQSIVSAPNARVGVLLNLGDLLSSDSVDPVTPTSKHLLDIDVKYQQMVRVVIKVIRQIVEMMRAKYEKVILVNVAGNHDFSSTMWMKEFFSVFYEACDDVEVDNTPDIYHVIEHGDVAIFAHHGHKRGVKDIPNVFVSKFREIYGRTKFAYAHLGHFHHQEVKENNLMVVEQHRTMVAPDAYATNGGYKAGRSAYVITYHKAFGEVSRINIGAEMISV
jgi:hypothetical protein